MTQSIPPFLRPVAALVDQTIERLAAKRFAGDPIVAPRYSAITSIVSSAYKRHGSIIEQALIRTLAEAPHLEVWGEPQFRVSEAADRLADSDTNAFGASLPYSAERFARTLQIDIIVYNREVRRIGAYESKRGFGYHDAGKRRSMLRDMRCAQMLLKSYGESYGKDINDTVAHMIFYYGQCSLGRPWSITREDLDTHFGFEVRENIEIINKYFGSKLDDLLSSL